VKSRVSRRVVAEIISRAFALLIAALELTHMLSCHPRVMF